MNGTTFFKAIMAAPPSSSPSTPIITMTGWWFQQTPLKNDGVSSSVGMIFHSQYMKKKSKPPTKYPLTIIIHH